MLRKVLKVLLVCFIMLFYSFADAIVRVLKGII